MAHIVKCKICGLKFDRDLIAYVKPSAKRYAHASCYLREKEKNSNLPELEIYDSSDVVPCIYCGKKIDKKHDEYKHILNKKYAHLTCFELEEKREKTDAERLDLYIMKIFEWDYVHPRVKQQIKQYIDEYNFTYSGIQKTLQYFYEVKGNPIEKAHGGIGITPFIYQDAYRYYYSIWEAHQKNKDIQIKEFKPSVKEISIPPPQRNIKKRKLFTFLDQEESE